jgi:hypothetical protein
MRRGNRRAQQLTKRRRNKKNFKRNKQNKMKNANNKFSTELNTTLRILHKFKIEKGDVYQTRKTGNFQRSVKIQLNTSGELRTELNLTVVGPEGFYINPIVRKREALNTRTAKIEEILQIADRIPIGKKAPALEVEEILENIKFNRDLGPNSRIFTDYRTEEDCFTIDKCTWYRTKKGELYLRG